MSKLTVSDGHGSKQKSVYRPLQMWDAMDDFMDRFINYAPFKTSGLLSSRSNELKLNPKVDIVENTTGYALSAELPGLELNDIHLEVNDGVLTLSGEKKSENHQEKGDNYHMMERSYGMFSRTFTLPPSVDSDKIKAQFSKGVVTITLPKSEQSQERQRKISIKEA